MRPRRDASQRYLLAKFSGFESDSSLSYDKSYCCCLVLGFELVKTPCRLKSTVPHGNRGEPSTMNVGGQ